MHQPEVRGVLADVDEFSRASTRLSKAVEDLPADVAAERQAAMDQLFVRLAAERTQALEAVSKELTAQREQTLKDLDQRQGELHGVLQELQETAKAMDAMAKSLTTTFKAGESLAERVSPTPTTPTTPTPPTSSDSLTDYRAAVEKTSEAADRLNALALSLDRLVGQGREPGTSNLHAAAADLASVGAASEHAIDHAFNRLLALVIAAPLMVALAAVLYRVVTVRVVGVRVEGVTSKK
jgi:hypothetical protein